MTRFLLALALLVAGLPMTWADGPTYRAPRMAAPAQEVSPFSYTGLYLDVAGGFGVSDSELSATDGGSTANIDGLSGRGPLGQARIGFDWQLSNGLVVGVFGGYGLGTIDGSASFNSESISWELTPTWHAGGRVGIVGPWNALLYVGYAYGEAELDIGSSFNLCSGSVNCSHTLGGHTGLIGLEVPLGKAWSLATEYDATFYDSARLFEGGGSTVNLEPVVHVVWARLKFRPVSLFGN